jgi:hypothetical protein
MATSMSTGSGRAPYEPAGCARLKTEPGRIRKLTLGSCAIPRTSRLSGVLIEEWKSMSTMFSETSKVVGLWLAATSLAVAQTTYTCAGVPRGVSMGNGGTLVVESLGGLNWTYLCGVETPQNGVSVAACKGLHASLLVAQSTGQPMTLWFTNAAATCAGNTPWAFAAGLYFWRTGP